MPAYEWKEISLKTDETICFRNALRLLEALDTATPIVCNSQQGVTTQSHHYYRADAYVHQRSGKIMELDFTQMASEPCYEEEVARLNFEALRTEETIRQVGMSSLIMTLLPPGINNLETPRAQQYYVDSLLLPRAQRNIAGTLRMCDEQ